MKNLQAQSATDAFKNFKNSSGGVNQMGVMLISTDQVHQ